MILLARFFFFFYHKESRVSGFDTENLGAKDSMELRTVIIKQKSGARPVAIFSSLISCFPISYYSLPTSYTPKF